MTPEAWIALAGFIVTLLGAIITVTYSIAKIEKRTDEKITNVTLAYERKLSQSDAGLRALLTEMGFFIRDNFVQNEIFNKMIDMASANNENQFRALTESMNRVNDRLDAIQVEIRHSQS